MSIRQHVLVPVDFSDISLNGVRTANELAYEETEITLLHIYDPERLRESQTFDFTPREKGLPLEVEKTLLEKLQKIRKELLSNVNTVRYEIAVSRFPAKAVCEQAERLKADLVILTTHGRTGLRHLLMGSVAEEVVRKAPCPVLVMRPSK
jgi:nucleotide-binding universal stress UspA family protein